MMTDESVLEWASGWLRDSPPEDPTFRERFLQGLARELRSRELRFLGVETQASVLYRDVNDMMNTLRCVASAEYTREEVREQAVRSLDRLKKNGVGDQ